MKHNFKKLVGLITATIAAQASYQKDLDNHIKISQFDFGLDSQKNHTSILNLKVSDYLAYHRSHRSHSSHRSHRSSSSGSSYYNYSSPNSTYSTSKYTSSTNTVSNSDVSEEQLKVNTSVSKLNDTDSLSSKRENVIRLVQQTLALEGLYNSAIDGKMGPKTREGIKKYKLKYNIKSKSLLGVDVLNAMGIKGF